MRQLDALRLADFCHELRFDTLPAPVQALTRTLLVDTLGCLIGGLRYPQVKALGDRLGVGGLVTDVPFARLVTWGAAATWLDADSGGSFHPQGHRIPPVPTAHPAPHVLPVLLHHARAGSRTDGELLTVFAAAMEVGLRFGVGTSLRPGFHPHGVHGPVAAAVAQSLLTGLDRQTTAHAILLALSQPLTATLAVPMRGGTVRNIWTGLGTFLGAQAAERADSGVRGQPRVVRELFDQAVCTHLDLEEIESGLGTRWRLPDSYLKPYACARWIHPALDAFTEAVVSSGRQVGAGIHHDISAVNVSTFAFAASLDARDVDTDMHARFSMPTCVAALAVHGRLAADAFLPTNLVDERVMTMTSAVGVSEDPAYTAALPRERPATVTITWRGGDTSTGTVRNARGNPDQPLSCEEVEQKFRGNAGDVADAFPVMAVLRGTAGPQTLTTHLRRTEAQLASME